jgi:hypothetical protein
VKVVKVVKASEGVLVDLSYVFHSFLLLTIDNNDQGLRYQKIGGSSKYIHTHHLELTLPTPPSLCRL